MHGYRHTSLCTCTHARCTHASCRTCMLCYLSETVPEDLLFFMTPAKPGVPEAAPQLLPLSLTANQWPDLDLLLFPTLLLWPTKQPTFHRVNQQLGGRRSRWYHIDIKKQVVIIYYTWFPFEVLNWQSTHLVQALQIWNFHCLHVHVACLRMWWD